MNANRRAEIKQVMERIDKLVDPLSEIAGEVEELKDFVDQLRQEEEDYLQNLPDNLQGSARAEAAREALDELERAHEKLEDLHGALDIDLSNIREALEEAAA